MQPSSPQFDPIKYKNTTHDQWQSAAEAWYRWSPTLHHWLGPSTEMMLDMAGITNGHRVLDIAAGAGEQSIAAAKRAGTNGYVLATDISANILAFARQLAMQSGIHNMETRVMDGENLTLDDNSFDAVISRVGLIYFPDQQKALKEMLRVLKPGGRLAAVVYSTPEKNTFFSVPIGIIRERAKLPPPLPGQPGPFSLGADGVIKKVFEQAGFINVKAVYVDAPLLMPSTDAYLQFAQESFGALHQMMSGLSADEKIAVWETIRQELLQFETAKGFAGPCELVVASGEKG
ncbi:MAG: class I SAM-dependent methyltransferase [Bacteroidetes bacterium]|nr:class I SAM-dependent methyltransferase [Bacteroidota bacterium]